MTRPDSSGWFGRIRSFFESLGDDNLPPNVVRNGNGKLSPAPGFEWCNGTAGDFSVRWVPGKRWLEQHLVAGPAPGDWRPAPGWDWVSPNDPACREVRWQPGAEDEDLHLEALDAEGCWGPAPGYRWVRPWDPESGEVRWSPGLPHSRMPHVFAAGTEGKWGVEPGFRWLNSDPKDLRVTRGAGNESGNRRGQGTSAANDPPRIDVQRIKDLATLGLEESAGATEVDRAFRRLVRVHHPDRFAREGAAAAEEAHRAFLLLRSAYDRLRGVNGGRA